MKLSEMKLRGGEIAVRKTELEAKSVLKKLSGVYEEHAKLLFLFDVSGSMADRVARSYEEQYAWTPELLAEIRQKVEAALRKLASGVNPLAAMLDPSLAPSFEECELAKLADDSPDPNAPPALTCDDEELKRRVIRCDLISALGVQLNWGKQQEVPLTRIEIVRRLAKQEIQARFNKFPKSNVTVIPFAASAVTRFDGGKPEDLWPVLEALSIGYGPVNAGATVILAAVEKALTACRANPSPVGIHHIIIVSDGQDWQAHSEIGNWVPTLKASGVVLDYIHIGDLNPNTGIAIACKALGGDCVTVNSERALEEKFVEAVRRPLLPPATRGKV